MPPPGGTRTDLTGLANAVARRSGASGATYTWGGQGTGVDITQYQETFQPGGVFSPGYPLVPTEQQRVRAWDFSVAYNTTQTPRSYEPIGFKELRALAENHNITRLCIETRKDQIESFEWQIRPKDEDNVSADTEAAAAKLTEFWRRPDGATPFASWVRQLIEEVLVTDAPALEVRYNRVGEIIGFDAIDGGTIKILLDETGRTPAPPAPAFEQVIHGKPWVLLEDGTRVNTEDKGVPLTDRQLIYMPRNSRAHKAYGFSPVEQIVLTVNIGLRREFQQLQYFTEGNVPAGLAQAPDGWNPDQIAGYQAWFDSYLAGNIANKTRIIWGPHGSQYQAVHDSPFKDKFDEWLARLVCFAFSLPPNAFVERVNRATAETAQAAALSEGLGPLLAWVKRLIDSIIQNRMGYPDLEFAWAQPDELDPKTQVDIQVALVKEGIISRNEARDELGYQPDPDGDVLMTDTMQGPVPLSRSLNPPEPVQPGSNSGAQTQSGTTQTGKALVLEGVE